MNVVLKGRGGPQGFIRTSGTSGVTLMELIVVLVIFALMAAVVVPTFARLGFFSRTDLQDCTREIHALLKAAKIYAATYRADTAIVYGIALRKDSLAGLAVDAIDSVAMVYKVPKDIRDNCYMFYRVNGEAIVPPIKLPSDENAFVSVQGEQEKGMFRPLPGETGLVLGSLLPNGNGNAMRDTLQAIRLYRIGVHHYDTTTGNPVYEASIVPPLRVAAADTEIMGSLPPQLAYLQTFPVNGKYLEYSPALGPAPPAPSEESANDFRFPAHVFTPSGRMDTASSALERFEIQVGYLPDVDPRERFANGADWSQGLRAMNVELYRSTGRVFIVRDQG